MRFLFGIVVTLFVAVGIAAALREDPGYVLISRGPWTIETSVVAMIIGLILAFIVLYLVIRYLVRLLHTPRYVAAARKRRAQRLLNKGMRLLAEGRWTAAETALTKSAPNSEVPALNYIGAARAANALDADWRRDAYLRRAAGLPPKDKLVIDLTRAEYMLEDGKPAEASATLRQLSAQSPHHHRVLELLARSHRALGEWDRLKNLLPELKKRQVLEESQYAALEKQVYSEILAETARTGTLAELQDVWKQAPEPVRRDEGIIIEYAGHLRDNNAPTEAESLLQDAVNRQWSDRLVVGYGELGRGNFNIQLNVAEDWLKQHGDNPYLLLTLGRLAKRCRQFDKARSYLEQSIRALPTPDAYQELGETLEELNDVEAANRCYRAGLWLASGKTVEAAEKAGLPVVEGAMALPAGQEAASQKAASAS